MNKKCYFGLLEFYSLWNQQFAKIYFHTNEFSIKRLLIIPLIKLALVQEKSTTEKNYFWSMSIVKENI